MTAKNWQVRLNPPGPNTVQCASDWSWNISPAIADYDLLAIHSGRGSYRAGDSDTVIEAMAGTCILLRKGCRYFCKTDPANPMRVSYVHFEYVNPCGKVITPEPEMTGDLSRQFHANHLIFELINKMAEAWRFQNAPSAANTWLAAALLEYLSPAETGEGESNERAGQIRSLCRQIRQEPQRIWRIDDLARQAACTRDHLGRLFRKFVGQSPGEYIIQARIEAAMQLLKTSDHSITRIAELLGYCDVYAFSRQFSNRTGLSPKAYRKER